ncbi:lipopolysaccharide assembly protein LapB [Pedobacter sp. L105]|uniref:type IX secretion system periplasmic lipoprotein PorW/SprE n=1 Tax=Pedobacter sp. L105 TaxID=1641871 RepID=UPI0020B10D41|nr:gliding motility protein [Pedobacter sp. L105]
MSRGMQNLTARYNYIYNSKVILENYGQQLNDTYKDNYNEILPVFTDPEKFSASTVFSPSLNDKALDKIIVKAQAIIADKVYSNYIDDAYLLLGKANYFKSNYFIAEEFFDYTAKTYPANPEVLLTAQNWKARSLMQLDDLRAAALLLDTVYTSIPSVKSNTSEPLATIAQMYIYQERYDDAIQLLERAVRETPLKRNRIRWTYILAQLYEHQKNEQKALANYLKVQNSNAGFELYFNANLNRIKINGLLNGEKLNRKKQLLALLRDDKNLEYNDQIYFQVAESYASDEDYINAEKYYKLSLRKSLKNNYQKGLSYLRLANLNFSRFRNFLQAKLYYDSTVNTMPKNYPGYAQIIKKSRNLEYISTRYEAIAMQDTLQSMVKLSPEERLARIKKMTAKKAVINTMNTGTYRENLFPDAGKNNNSATEPKGAFYFNNSAAMSKGYTDFVTRWGTRKQEDNWRQSQKSSSQNTSEQVAKVEDSNQPLRQKQPSKSAGTDTLVNRYLSAIPLTPEMLIVSNQKIIDSYYEMAIFYQQELDDREEATRIYQLVLNRFPDNNHLASIYYSLYLNFKKSDPANSSKYKALLLAQFPSSNYAKTILDPGYSAKQSEMEALVLKKYNLIFDQYEKKAFPEVIADVSQTTAQYPANQLNPQLNYLKAISIGRTHMVDSLVTAFKMIVTSYPDDKLITPLVKNHLAYIAAHMDEFRARRFALPDFNPADQRFFTAFEKPIHDNTVPPVVNETATPVEKVAAAKKEELTPDAKVAAPVVAVNTDKIFSTAPSAIYYFVIDVEDASLTLSSSRFGIGQFNRGNYADAGLKHQLTEFDNDQLIYIGNFSSFADAKSYAYGITPQLKQIMKVPAGIYSSFIISKENFDKLQSKTLLTQYLDFYKNHY